MIVDGEVDQAAAQFEELLPGVAVPLVLLDGILHRLLRQAVLQFEGGDGQAVDEQANVQGKLCVVVAVSELPGHAEAVLPVQGRRLRVPRRRRAIHQVYLVRTVLHALPQHVDGPALGDLPLQPSQELAPGRAILSEAQRRGSDRLSGVEEGRELGQVDAVLAVVVVRVAAYPAEAVDGRPLLQHAAFRRRVAGRARQRLADQALQPPLAGVGGHAMPRLA